MVALGETGKFEADAVSYYKNISILTTANSDLRPERGSFPLDHDGTALVPL